MHIFTDETVNPLVALLDQFSLCDPDFDDTEELERQFAELRLSFCNP
jgi:hypothetical protein